MSARGLLGTGPGSAIRTECQITVNQNRALLRSVSYVGILSFLFIAPCVTTKFFRITAFPIVSFTAKSSHTRKFNLGPSATLNLLCFVLYVKFKFSSSIPELLNYEIT